MFFRLHSRFQFQFWLPDVQNFWISNFTLGMPKTFGHGSEGEILKWKLFLDQSKKLWHSQNEIRFPKYWLRTQKFRPWSSTLYNCKRGLFHFFNFVFKWVHNIKSQKTYIETRILQLPFLIIYQNSVWMCNQKLWS